MRVRSPLVRAIAWGSAFATCCLLLLACGGGGSSNGGLCEKCGDTSGPCRATADVERSSNAPPPCNVLDPGPATTPCYVELRCLRKLDSAQRRCFAVDPTTGELDILFRCDGARPNPNTATPLPATPTVTTTPTSSATSTPTS